MYYSNGDTYEGQWRNDKPDGEGMLRLGKCPAPPHSPAPKALQAPPCVTTPLQSLLQRGLRWITCPDRCPQGTYTLTININN